MDDFSHLSSHIHFLWSIFMFLYRIQQFDFVEVSCLQREGLKSSEVESGAQYVTTVGISMMLMLFAGS